MGILAIAEDLSAVVDFKSIPAKLDLAAAYAGATFPADVGEGKTTLTP